MVQAVEERIDAMLVLGLRRFGFSELGSNKDVAAEIVRRYSYAGWKVTFVDGAYTFERRD